MKCGYFCFTVISAMTLENENKSNPNINFNLMYMKQSMKSKGFERRLLF